MLFRYSNIIIFINSFFRSSWWRWPWMESRISWYQWRREWGQLFRYLKNFAQHFSLPITWVLSKPWMRKVWTRLDHLLDARRDILTYLETWLSSYFFMNKTFLFVRIESWKFHLNSVWMSCNFARFHKILNQRNS